MCNQKIRLYGVNDIKRFVDDMMTLPGEVNIKSGKVEVSAKSIMSLFALDLRKELDVIYLGRDEVTFSRLISEYIR